MMSIQSRFYTVRETAQLLHVCPHTVIRMLDAGELPSVRFRGLRRVSRRGLDAWIEAQEHDAAGQARQGKVIDLARLHRPAAQ